MILCRVANGVFDFAGMRFSVEQAIADPWKREAFVYAVQSEHGASIFRRARALVSQWHNGAKRVRYHGEKKRRKAMRRLLLSAGVTRST